ncbi:hypothetical protein [Streptomyces alfalfae]
MTTARADALARHTGRLLCHHLALAMTLTAAFTAHPVDSCRPALYWLWAALPLTATAWALARAHQKHLQAARAPPAHQPPHRLDTRRLKTTVPAAA